MAISNGFSLLDLIVTLALIAILAAISALSHRALRPGLDLGSAARQVAMDLKVTRLRAVARNVNHRIVFADASGTYQPQRKVGTQYADDGFPVAMPRGIVVADCSARDGAIGFRPRGNAATFGTVTIRNANGQTRRIIVDIAGEIQVQP